MSATVTTCQRRAGARGQVAGRQRGHGPRLGAHPARLQGRAFVRQRQRRLVLRPDPGRRAGDAGQLRQRSHAPHRRLRRDRRPARWSPSQGKGQAFEIQATAIEVVGWVEDPETYPIQPKQHSLEFLREVAHLRPRTNLFGAVTRVRHSPARGRPPLLPRAAASSGSTRRSSPPPTPRAPGRCSASPRSTWPTCRATTRARSISRSDFFGKEAFLTVSGQLNVEAYCLALSKVYTFGPTFRAENSNTHAPPRRVLDDRAGDRLRRPRRRRATSPRTSSSTSSAPCSHERADDMAFFAERVDKDCDHAPGSVRQRAVRAHRLHRRDRHRCRSPGKKFEFPVEWGWTCRPSTSAT